MTVSKHEVTAVVAVGLGITLDVVDARITLDDGWMPYIQAELTCWTPEEAELELIDPRDQLRVTLTVTKTQAAYNPGQLVDQVRTLDLLLRGREVDHETGTMVLTAESDEALLQDLALVATTSERVYGLSAKTAVEYALAKVGAVLAAGASDVAIDPDPNLPATVTNLIPNPSVETNTTGFTSSAVTMTRVNEWSQAGAWSLRLSAPTTIDSFATITLTTVVGQKYTVSAYRRIVTPLSGSEIANRARGFLVYDGTTSATLASTTSPNVAGVERVMVTFTATSTSTVIRLYNGHTVGTIWWDALMVTEGATLEDYFDGATADTDLFDYAWTGAADASTSTRTAKPNSSMMIWEPGTTAWDYLEPLLQATGLRLYCDETRTWTLEPSGTARAGQLNLAAAQNVTAATDQISRTAEWYDAVVIAYTRALDPEGRQVTVYDVAGAPGTKALVLEYARPYPGAGAAQAVLNRAQGRGRVLDLEAISDYLATPGMAVIATLPDSPIQTGTISRVTWSFPDDRMRIGSRGLTDTPDTAWALAPEGLAWEDIAIGVDWTEYTPS